MIGHSGRFLSAAQRVGAEFDKTWFIVGSGRAGAGKNVSRLDYNNIHIGYLMGVLAAKHVEDRQDRRRVRARRPAERGRQYVGGFRLGAKATKPDIEVKVIYIKDMEERRRPRKPRCR